MDCVINDWCDEDNPVWIDIKLHYWYKITQKPKFKYVQLSKLNWTETFLSLLKIFFLIFCNWRESNDSDKKKLIQDASRIRNGKNCDKT